MNARTAARHAERRIRRTRGACGLVRGGDNYDHRGLNRARRMAARSEILISLEEMEQEWIEQEQRDLELYMQLIEDLEYDCQNSFNEDPWHMDYDELSMTCVDEDYGYHYEFYDES